MVLDIFHREHTNPSRKNERKPFKWILVDSAVIGGIAMFAASPSIFPTSPDHLWVMLKAFLGAFLLQLGIERGIKRGK